MSLSNMFAQINAALQPMGNLISPLADQASKSAGGLLGSMTGQAPEEFMSEGGRKAYAQEAMANLDLNTVEGLKEASRLALISGDRKGAAEMAVAAREQNAREVALLEQGGEAVTAEAQRKRALAMAKKNKDEMAYNAISAGILTPKEYIESLMTDRQARLEAALKHDPYKGAFTETVKMDGSEYKVRYNSAGQPIAILGQGREDVSLTELVNPDTGILEKVLVNQQTGSTQFLGQAEMPEYTIKEEGGKFHVFDQAGQRVRTVDSMSEAEKEKSKQVRLNKLYNMLGTASQARQLIAREGGNWNGVGGWSGLARYLPGTDARRLEGYVETLKSNLGFQALTDLKAEGGTLGQIAIYELMMLQAEVAKLDTFQDASEIDATLARIEEIHRRVAKAVSTDGADSLIKKDKAGNNVYKVDENTYIVQPEGEEPRIVVGE